MAGTNVPWRTDDLYLFFGFYSDDLNTDTGLNGNWMANNKERCIQQFELAKYHNAGRSGKLFQ
ncbi:MAG: hypothetical protein ACLUOS_11890 [Odoribacter splanchnicus]